MMANFFVSPVFRMLLAGEGGGETAPALKLFEPEPAPLLVLFLLVVAILIVWWALNDNKKYSDAETGGHGHDDHGGHGHDDHGHADHGGHDDHGHGEAASHGHEAPAEPAHAEPAHAEKAAEIEPEVLASAPLPAPGAPPEEVLADAAPAVEAAPEAPAAPAQPDDLKIIEGIGPKISKMLAEQGIVTFAQLAATPVERLQEIMLAANLRIADPTTWPAQAMLAAEGKWEELQTMQDSLKGGRVA